MQLIRRVTIDTTEILSPHVPTHSAAAMRKALTDAAYRVYGREGRDWRLVQDQTVIGGHIRALGPWDGETIEIQ